jgi:hypothetical protein
MAPQTRRRRVVQRVDRADGRATPGLTSVHQRAREPHRGGLRESGFPPEPPFGTRISARAAPDGARSRRGPHPRREASDAVQNGHPGRIGVAGVQKGHSPRARTRPVRGERHLAHCRRRSCSRPLSTALDRSRPLSTALDPRRHWRSGWRPRCRVVSPLRRPVKTTTQASWRSTSRSRPFPQDRADPILGMHHASAVRRRVATMSSRMHFWLRLVGVGLILTLEFGPRAWSACSMAPAARVAAASTAR